MTQTRNGNQLNQGNNGKDSASNWVKSYTLLEPESLTLVEIFTALCSHARGDWGDVSASDAEGNDVALVEGFRLFSVYNSAGGIRFWVITEADRSVTTILLPNEY